MDKKIDVDVLVACIITELRCYKVIRHAFDDFSEEDYSTMEEDLVKLVKEYLDQ